MNCKRCRSRIYDLLDDGRSPADDDRVREHLDGCAKCRQFLRDEARLAELIQKSTSLRMLRYLGGMPSSATEAARYRAPGPTDFSPAIPAGPGRSAAARRAWFRRFAWGAAAAAAFIILGLGGYFLLRSPSGGASGIGPTAKDARIETAPRVHVISVELNGKPAKPFIYQTPKVSFIWIVPSKDIGG